MDVEMATSYSSCKRLYVILSFLNDYNSKEFSKKFAMLLFP